MSIYLRGRVWYYLFYLNGRRYRGSAKTKNRKKAERSEAPSDCRGGGWAVVKAEAGASDSGVCKAVLGVAR
jgi:hypothetical protein